MEERKMYFGPALVTTVVEMEQKTPSGGDVVKVYLDRPIQPYEVLPKASFEKLVSLEPIEDTLFQAIRYRPVLAKLAEVLLESGIIYSDIPYVCKTLHNNLSASYERATNFLWTKNDKEYISGVHELTNRSLLEAEAILQSANKKDDTEQPAEKE